MKSITIFLAILPLVLCSACSGNSPLGVALPANSYSYASYDTSGTQVAAGFLTIIIQDSIHVAGQWKIKKIGDPQHIGPQIGSGTLAGSFCSGKLFISLNPNFVDNNVFLEGTFDGKQFEGRWTYSSFIGLTGMGTFKAIR